MGDDTYSGNPQTEVDEIKNLVSDDSTKSNKKDHLTDSIVLNDIVLADKNFNSLALDDKDLDNQLKKEKLDNNIYDRKLKRRWSLIIVGVLLVFVAMQFGYSLSLLLGFDFSLLGANPLTNAQRFKLMAILMGTNFIEVIGLVIIVLKYLFSSDKTDLN